MSDDSKNRGEPDRSLVSTSQDHEIRYWTHRFGVSEDKLRRAVAAVGNSVNAVEQWLKSNS